MEKQHQLQLVTFILSGEEYGINILEVHEIKRLKEIGITYVPQAPEFVEGVMNLRGDVIPVIDLGKRFDLDNHKRDKETRIIVVKVEEKFIGLLVDRVNEVLTIDQSVIEEPPPEITQIDSFFISGIARYEERLVIMLDILNILSSGEQPEVPILAE